MLDNIVIAALCRCLTAPQKEAGHRAAAAERCQRQREEQRVSASECSGLDFLLNI